MGATRCQGRLRSNYLAGKLNEQVVATTEGLRFWRLTDATVLCVRLRRGKKFKQIMKTKSYNSTKGESSASGGHSMLGTPARCY